MTALLEKHLKQSELFLAKQKKINKRHVSILQRLPDQAELWHVGAHHSGHKYHQSNDEFIVQLEKAQSHRQWQWPQKQIFFIADPHADPDAFLASLVATGGIKLSGPTKLDFKLTKTGREAIFIIGGDCLDKGPANLGLLDVIKVLMDSDANVKLLAGNHDMRLYMGIHAIGLDRHPATEHMFVRMGDKVLPLFKEVYNRYLMGKKLPSSIPDEAECKALLFPSEDWFEQFSAHAQQQGLMTQAGIERELRKMRRKYNHFEHACAHAGFSMREVYAIAMKCRKLFLKRRGKYYWFFHEMQLAFRRGSFLFIHAGLDDAICGAISEHGVQRLNKRFRQQIKHDLFSFYYGSIANTMRTKYRVSDLPLSSAGVEEINKSGIHAVVQGHINRRQGQRLVFKHGLLHIESDVTLDRFSRRKEGLSGYGIGVTVIDPKKRVIGISSDYEYAKVFNPDFYRPEEDT
jgi:hypothetical protein